MLERIKNIEEVYDVSSESLECLKSIEYSGMFDGFKITTSKNIWYILISNIQQCCENFGYVSKPEDYKDYIGAGVYFISRTVRTIDDDIETIPLSSSSEYPNCMFITFYTDKGDLQFTAYNEHNGYYGHNVVIVKDTYLKELKEL